MGFGVPALGMLVGLAGYGAAFAAGAVTAVASLAIAMVLARRARIA